MKKLSLMIILSLAMWTLSASSLVVYFSATGNTEGIANKIAETAGADIYRIEPAIPYTSADLNYNDRSSRTSIERNDSSIRPEIASSRIDISSYDIIYVGYPIWWADMPRILYTFFDKYDFGGKTIAPFCTSGGSGLSSTRRTISRLEPGATVTEGLSITTSRLRRSDNAIREWVEKVGK